MSKSSQAQQQAPPPSAEDRIELPGENLTLQETLRVMDVAREMREQRETAEEMFRRDDIRKNLRDKLMRTARMSCLLYTSPSPRDRQKSRMPSSA